MASETNSLKKRILKLLEEDEEFRYVVAAKIGLLKILEKLDENDRKFNEILEKLDRNEKILLRHEEEIKKIWKKLEEHDRKFNEILKRLDKHEEILIRHEEELKKIWAKLDEHDRKFNEILAELREHRRKLEEHDRKFNEILEELRDHRRRLEEHSRILEEHTRILEEHSRTLEEHTRMLDRHTRMLGSLGEDIGVLSEAMLSRFVRDDVFDTLKLRGARVLEVRRRYIVNGYEVDLYIETMDEVIVLEVKMRPSVRDVDRLARVRDYLAEKKRKNVRAILASYHAKTRRSIVERAEKKNIELMTY